MLQTEHVYMHGSKGAVNLAGIISSARPIHAKHPIPSDGTTSRLSLQASIVDLLPQMVLQTLVSQCLSVTQNHKMFKLNMSTA